MSRRLVRSLTIEDLIGEEIDADVVLAGDVLRRGPGRARGGVAPLARPAGARRRFRPASSTPRGSRASPPTGPTPTATRRAPPCATPTSTGCDQARAACR